MYQSFNVYPPGHHWSFRERKKTLCIKSFFGWNKILEEAFRGCYSNGFSQTQPLDVFCKKVVLKKFAKFRGKHRGVEFFFKKVTGLSLQIYSQKRPWERSSAVNFVRFFGTPTLKNFSGQLLLKRVLLKRLFWRFWKNPWKAFVLVSIFS